MSANKQQMREKLAALRTELDGYLASEYGIDRRNISKQAEYDKQFAQWQQSHQPFHWWVEFYGIMKRGGFDVIIGNPPYVEYSKVKQDYTIQGYRTENCGNLYAFLIERSFVLLNSKQHFGMIVPLSTFCTQRMNDVWYCMKSDYADHWISHFGWRPAKLFEGVNLRLAIALTNSTKERKGQVHTTKFHKWNSEAREFLLKNLSYMEISENEKTISLVPKINSTLEKGILRKVMACSRTMRTFASLKDELPIYYKNTGVNHWITATYFPPKAFRGDTLSQSSRQTIFATKSQKERSVAACCLNSNLFYWFYVVQTNCRDLNPSDIKNFPVPEKVEEDDSFSILGQQLMDSLDTNSGYITRNQKQTGSLRLQSFSPGRSKLVIDEIDCVLARHYGFTDEELDFIINYDIKYRMSGDNGDEGEE